MTQGINRTLTPGQCTLSRVHGPHSWRSRKQGCYFQCLGRHTPRRSS